MDFMELRRETTRFRREAQYLPGQSWAGGTAGGHRDVAGGGTVARHPETPQSSWSRSPRAGGYTGRGDRGWGMGDGVWGTGVSSRHSLGDFEDAQ